MKIRRRTAPRGVGRLLRRVAHFALALALSVAIVRAGTSYIYCVGMQEVRTEACCKRPCLDGASDCAIYARHDCCAVKKLPAMPAGALEAAEAVPAAPLLTVHPPPPLPIAVVPTSLAAARFEQRSTGPPPRPSEIPPRLQVFLI